MQPKTVNECLAEFICDSSPGKQLSNPLGTRRKVVPQDDAGLEPIALNVPADARPGGGHLSFRVPALCQMLSSNPGNETPLHPPEMMWRRKLTPG